MMKRIERKKNKESFGATKKTTEMDFGWGTCIAKGKGLMSHPCNS